jgi:hypothetical protein
MFLPHLNPLSTWYTEICRTRTPFFHRPVLSVSDITSMVALNYIREELPELDPPGGHPVLDAHWAACEALPAFKVAPYSIDEALRTGWRPEGAYSGMPTIGRSGPLSEPSGGS